MGDHKNAKYRAAEQRSQTRPPPSRTAERTKKKLVGNNCDTENVMENNNETKRVKIKHKNRARGHTQSRYPNT